MKQAQLAALLAFVVAVIGAERGWAITAGQVDDFEDGTVQGWIEGGGSPNPPVNVVSGGNPGRFLEDVSTGFGRAGSRLVMFNQSQWAGNYVDAGIASVDVDLMNVDGGSPLPIRLAVQGPGGTQFGSVQAFQLPADNQWHTASFGLSADDLALVTGGASLEAVLSTVDTVRILSAAGGPAWRGDSVAARLGVDNITAVTAGPALQAGDADQDLDFDQLDLVRVQIAAKYLTGQPATWGDGDWNGAPGGRPGNPPAGDGLFNQFDIIAAQQANVYLTGPYAAISAGGHPGDDPALVRGDLTVVGSLAGGAALGDVDLTHVPVPEPASIVLLIVGAVGLLARHLARAHHDDP